MCAFHNKMIYVKIIFSGVSNSVFLIYSGFLQSRQGVDGLIKQM